MLFTSTVLNCEYRIMLFTNTLFNCKYRIMLFTNTLFNCKYRIMLFTNTVFNATVLGTTSTLHLLLFPQLTLEYNKIGNVCIDITLKRVRITTVAMKSNDI